MKQSGVGRSVQSRVTACRFAFQRSRTHHAARISIAAILLFGPFTAQSSANAIEANEIPTLQADIRAGKLPVMAKRLPVPPALTDFKARGLTLGRYGGTWNMLLNDPKDIALMSVYGYARLVGYDPKLNLTPDILERIEEQDGRIFTLHLRKGHRWSDGSLLSAEDFRYYWEDIATNTDVSPTGPPPRMLVNNTPPTFTVIDRNTVRFTWTTANPYFLPALAAADPLLIYRPAHYLKQFHVGYQTAEKLTAAVAAAKLGDWQELHAAKDRMTQRDNVDMPTLQPWINTTKSPAKRYVFKRNPYFHRVDPQGRQLPYIDEVAIQIAAPALIPAKVGTGEADLQANTLEFKNFTFLKAAEKRNNYDVRFWRPGKGAQLALYPNLNAKDPAWRALLRNPNVRRALSLAIDRSAINETVYFGFALEGNNTVLPDSPLYRESYTTTWAKFDLEQANTLLNDAGLDKRNKDELRLLPDGRAMEIVIETTEKNSERSDMLGLIAKSWLKAGIKLTIKPMKHETLDHRIRDGDAIMTVAYGIDAGLATPDTPPSEFVPTRDTDRQWPKWGNFVMTDGKSGTEPDDTVIKELLVHYSDWRSATTTAQRTQAWHKILALHADNVFSIGIVAGVPQPVVVRKTLRNVPKVGLYNWDPGAQFGIHHPDTFWIETD